MSDFLFFLTGLTIGGLAGFMAWRVSCEGTKKCDVSGNALSVLEARVEKLEALPINWASEIHEIIELAAEICGSAAEGANWLRTSVVDLGGAQPCVLMQTRAGAEQVLAFLKRKNDWNSPPG